MTALSVSAVLNLVSGLLYANGHPNYSLFSSSGPTVQAE